MARGWKSFSPASGESAQYLLHSPVELSDGDLLLVAKEEPRTYDELAEIRGKALGITIKRPTLTKEINAALKRYCRYYNVENPAQYIHDFRAARATGRSLLGGQYGVPEPNPDFKQLKASEAYEKDFRRGFSSEFYIKLYMHATTYADLHKATEALASDWEIGAPSAYNRILKAKEHALDANGQIRDPAKAPKAVRPPTPEPATPSASQASPSTPKSPMPQIDATPEEKTKKNDFPHTLAALYHSITSAPANFDRASLSSIFAAYQDDFEDDETVDEVHCWLHDQFLLIGVMGEYPTEQVGRCIAMVISDWLLDEDQAEDHSDPVQFFVYLVDRDMEEWMDDWAETEAGRGEQT